MERLTQDSKGYTEKISELEQKISEIVPRAMREIIRIEDPKKFRCAIIKLIDTLENDPFKDHNDLLRDIQFS